MPRSVRSTSIVLTLLLALLGACDEGTITPPPDNALPLPEGVWHLNTANDSTLPAVISERTVGLTFEETLLDSGFIDVRDDGTWEQRYWYRVFMAGNLDRSELVIDEGTWVEAPGGAITNTYVLTSTIRMRTFTVSFAPPATQLLSEETMLSYTDSPVIAGQYRRTRP